MLTAVITHPKFHDFKTTIRYINSVKQQRRAALAMKGRKVEAIPDPFNAGKVLLKKDGEPFTVLRLVFDDESFVKNAQDWLVAMDGMPPDIAETYKELEEEQPGYGVMVLIDDSLNVEGDVAVVEDDGSPKRDADGKIVTKRGLVAWSSALIDKANSRETFIPVPIGAGSPPSSTGA